MRDTTCGYGVKNNLILERENGLSSEVNKKCARVHFIPDLKVGAFVTLRAPIVVNAKVMQRYKLKIRSGIL